VLRAKGITLEQCAARVGWVEERNPTYVVGYYRVELGSELSLIPNFSTLLKVDYGLRHPTLAKKWISRYEMKKCGSFVTASYVFWKY
jgi:hypothetical protein